MMALIIYDAQRRFGRTKSLIPITLKGGLDETKPFYIYSRAKAVWTKQSRFMFISCKAVVVGQAQAFYDALSHEVLAVSLSVCTYNKNEEMQNVILMNE
jgi:hypothetical protein